MYVTSRVRQHYVKSRQRKAVYSSKKDKTRRKKVFISSDEDYFAIDCTGCSLNVISYDKCVFCHE